jgi:hypothetical protein
MFCEPGFDFFKRELKKSNFNYLEIGVFNGDSIHDLAKKFPEKTIFGVDPFIEDGCTMHTTNVLENEHMPTQKQNTMNNITGLDNIKFFEMTSIQFHNSLTTEMIDEMDIGWVLIDGSHHYKDVLNDTHLAMKLIGNRKGGIVFDDCDMYDVRKVVDEFLVIYTDNITKQDDLSKHIRAYYIN